MEQYFSFITFYIIEMYLHLNVHCPDMVCMLIYMTYAVY